MNNVKDNYQYQQNTNVVYKDQPGSPDPLIHLQDGLEGKARKNFIKKVYSILICNNPV